MSLVTGREWGRGPSSKRRHQFQPAIPPRGRSTPLGAELRPGRTAQVKDAGSEACSARERPRTPRWAAVAALAAALITVSSPASAGATGGSTYDPLASGQTTISFEKPFLALLKRYGVKLTATAPASLRSGTFRLPVSGGEYDPTIEKGTVSQEGSLAFVAGRRTVILRDVMLKIKPAPFYAKVGGGQLKLAGNAKTKVLRDGFGTRFTATDLRLTSKFATRLNKKLRLPGRPLKPGIPLATITSAVQPASVNVLEQGRATFVPDPGIFAKLHELHVSVNPVSPAELAPGPLFSLPIALKGRISPDGRSGLLKTEGGLEFLQLGAGQVFWHAFNFELAANAALAEVDVEPTPTFPGKLGQIPTSSFDLSGAAISSNPKARTITISGAHLNLSAQSAATFNQAFADNKPVFNPGELLGTVTFTAQGQ